MKETQKKKREVRLFIPDEFDVEVSLEDMKYTPIGVYKVMDVSANGLGLHVPVGNHGIERGSVRATLKSSINVLNPCGLFLNEKIDGNIRWCFEVQKGGCEKNAGIELYSKDAKDLFFLFGECLNEYLHNGNEGYLRQLIRNQVSFDKTDDGESLYKYLRRVLVFMDNFLNCNIGMIGYIDIVSEDGKRIITDAGSVFTGFEQEKYKKILTENMGRKISDLGLSDNYQKNQDDGYSCKAHSYGSEQIYVIQYPNGAGENGFDPRDFERNQEKMNERDMDAAKAGRFIRIHQDIDLEITIPIKPWYQHDYGPHSKRAA